MKVTELVLGGLIDAPSGSFSQVCTGPRSRVPPVHHKRLAKSWVTSELHSLAQLNSGFPRATSGICNGWEAHACILHGIYIIIASGLHVSLLRTHQHCTIFKLLLGNSQKSITRALQSPVSLISGPSLRPSLWGCTPSHPRSRRGHTSAQPEGVTPNSCP